MNDEQIIKVVDIMLNKKFGNSFFEKVDYVEHHKKHNKLIRKYCELIIEKVDKELSIK